MTPTRQAGSLLLAGFVSLLTVSAQAQLPPAQVPQPQAPQGTPAPIVRIPPRPRSSSQPRTQTSTQPGPQTTTTQPRSLVVAPAVPKPHQGTAVPSSNAETRPALRSATAPAITASRPVSPERRAATPPLSTSGLNRTVIVLDPGHGGTDSGARIGDSTLEKNVTLAFAFRLRSLLTARGFTVLLTRDSDTATEPNSPATALTLDDRAGLANHARASACLLLHATGRGTGVHLYSSELDPRPTEAGLTPWLTAQAPWVSTSQSLEQQLGAALTRSHIPLVSSTASVRPVDSLTCPALVVELAPQDEGANTINDAGYQERVAAAMAGALVFWKDAVQPPAHQAATSPSTPSPAHHTPTHHPAAPPPPRPPEPQP